MLPQDPLNRADSNRSYAANTHTPVPRRPRTSAAAVLWAVGGVSLLALAAMNQLGGAPTPSRTIAQPRAVTARGDLAEDEKSTIELFETRSGSVVYVSPMIKTMQRTMFGYRDVIQTGTGSGFIWDNDGNIVTNFHVIRDAQRCVVTLPDTSTHEASLVGVLPDKDIAVIHIDAPADKLVPIAVGTSSDLRVGQKVFAIGNPFGLDFTLTTGIVSALNREIRSVTGRTIQGVIQTDAAINPGNSGGPLLDSAGRLIGMNTAILSESGSSAGIGFAVPVDIIRRVVPQLISHGKVIRPGLGVNVADSQTASRLNLGGVLIVGVAKGSAAERAGLKPTIERRDGKIILGDVIVKIGDKPTPNLDALLNALESYEIGQTVQVSVDRLGEHVVVPVTLQAVE